MSKSPTNKQREQWEKLRELGCIICGSPAQIHHCFTGAGGRRDHDKVIPLCFNHHQGDDGIHTIGRKLWQIAYGTEQELLTKAMGMI